MDFALRLEGITLQSDDSSPYFDQGGTTPIVRA